MSLDIAASSITCLEHRAVAARSRATVLRRGRHLKEAAAADDEADRVLEELQQLRERQLSEPARDGT